MKKMLSLAEDAWTRPAAVSVEEWYEYYYHVLRRCKVSLLPATPLPCPRPQSYLSHNTSPWRNTCHSACPSISGQPFLPRMAITEWFDAYFMISTTLCSLQKVSVKFLKTRTPCSTSKLRNLYEKKLLSRPHYHSTLPHTNDNGHKQPTIDPFIVVVNLDASQNHFILSSFL